MSKYTKISENNLDEISGLSDKQILILNIIIFIIIIVAFIVVVILFA